jgi:serine protease Do
MLRRKFAVMARRAAVGCGLMGLSAVMCCRAHGQDIGWAVGQFSPIQRSRSEPLPLSRTREQAVTTREKSGTGFFVDDAGDMLTARHAADECTRLIVYKEGRAVAAHVVALATGADLALIKVPKTLGLAAVFPIGVGVGTNDMVFASAYDTLSAARGMLANATVASATGSQSGSLEIDSDVTFGASGAPVLDGRGLVQGIISRKTGTSRVIAVSAGQAKSFLAANGIRFEQDDRSQIAGAGSRANRAASISARITCLQN